MELDADEQVVEFDSSSSSSSSSDEGDSEDDQGNEDGDISSTEGEQTPTNGGKKPSRRKRKRAANLRRELRAKFDSLDDFNPEAKSAQSEELERIRRLELQQSITNVSQIPSESASLLSLPADQSRSTADLLSSAGTSSNVVTVDLTSVVAEPRRPRVPSVDAIVIESDDSEADSDIGIPASKRPNLVASSSSSSSVVVEAVKQNRAELLTRKYDGAQLRSDGRVLVNFGHAPEESHIFLSPLIASVAKPHQVCTLCLSVCVWGGGG